MPSALSVTVFVLGTVGLAVGIMIARGARETARRSSAAKTGNTAPKTGTPVTRSLAAEYDDDRDRLFNLSTDLLAIGDFDLNLHQVNPAWVRVLGWSRDELTKEPLRRLVDPRDEAPMVEAWERLKRGVAIEGFEARFRCRDGSSRWLSWDSFPYADRNLVFSVVRDLTAQKEAASQVLIYQERLRSLSHQLARVEERQRQDLALAIHDGLAQELFGIRAQMVLLKYPEKVPDLASVVAGIIEILDATMEDARNLSFELFPPVLHEVGLAAAIAWLAHSFSERTGIDCRASETVSEPLLSPEMRSMAYQCVRELLANVSRHARASEASISFAVNEPNLVLRVEDNGVGFARGTVDDAEAGREQTGGFGLFSIRERLRATGGHLHIESVGTGGTRVVMTLPLSFEPFGERPEPEVRRD